MAKTTKPIEFASLSGGLNTDSSPLNYQPDSASTLTNFNLNLDGTIVRRGGLVKVLQDTSDVSGAESDYVQTIFGPSDFDYLKTLVRDSIKAYIWKGAGDSGDVDILVLHNPQGSNLTFYRILPGSLKQIPTTQNPDQISLFTGPSIDFTSVGGRLIVAKGDGRIHTLSYDGTEVSLYTSTLKVRDIWGVRDVLVDGTDLNQEITVRPRIVYTNSQAEQDTLARHWYNLFNQGWGDLATPEGSQTEDIATSIFNTEYISLYGAGNAGTWPANSDNLTEYLYPDTGDTTNNTLDRFHAEDMIKGKSNSTHSPRGRYIIDLLDRATSRSDNYVNTRQVAVGRGGGLVDIPLNNIDTSPNTAGSTVVASSAGRVWYSGFTSEVTDAYDGSPDLSKMVLFSQANSDLSSIYKCYQDGDPTSKETPDILDTDGGVIVIQEANKIVRMAEFDTGMLVFATNGVWYISSEGGFRATDYNVKKVSNFGCISPNSVVVAGGVAFYLSQGNMRAVSLNEYGIAESNDISTGRVGNLIKSFSEWEIDTLKGSFNEVDNKVVFNYLNPSAEGASELILDLNLNNFYTKSYVGNPDEQGVVPIQTISLPQSLLGVGSDLVTVNSDAVQVNGQDVVVTVGNTGSPSVTELKIVIQINDDTPVRDLIMGFAAEVRASFNDWSSFPTSFDQGDPIQIWVTPPEVDAPAVLVTGYLTGGDTQRNKTVTYLTTLFNQTEDGFEEDQTGDLVPTNRSSCKVQAQWEWTNSANSNRWGREFQAYRLKRFYMPEDETDGYEDGHTVVTTKNKLRGKGKALSLKFTTEPEKDCQILGWSMNLGITNEV